MESATIATDCATFVTLQLLVNDTPQIEDPTPLEVCDDNTDGFAQFDLTSKNAEILDGLDATQYPLEVKRQVSLVSASSGLYQWLTPRELMWYFADLYDVPADLAAARVEYLSEQFGIREFLDRRCAGMSTGQQQRVNLARSLMHDPPVVLMDEPTRGLDIVGSSRIFEFTALLREQGKAVVFCTHRLDEAERLCSRFGLMNHGRLCLEGTLEDLRESTGLDHLAEMFLQLMNSPDTTGAGPRLGSVAEGQP